MSNDNLGHIYYAHVVIKGSDLYNQGRALAKKQYEHFWQADISKDLNDFSIVITENDKPVANVCIQVKNIGIVLQSELIYGEEYWVNQINPGNSVVEFTSFAIDTEKKSLSVQLLSLIFITMYLKLCSSNISLALAIQRDSLVKFISEYLLINIIKLNVSLLNDVKIPNNSYWLTDPKPNPYYLCIDEEYRTRVSKLALLLALTEFPYGVMLDDTHSSVPNFLKLIKFM
jgi:hypothetical protein